MDLLKPLSENPCVLKNGALCQITYPTRPPLSFSLTTGSVKRYPFSGMSSGLVIRPLDQFYYSQGPQCLDVVLTTGFHCNWQPLALSPGDLCPYIEQHNRCSLSCFASIEMQSTDFYFFSWDSLGKEAHQMLTFYSHQHTGWLPPHWLEALFSISAILRVSACESFGFVHTLIFSVHKLLGITLPRLADSCLNKTGLLPDYFDH